MTNTFSSIVAVAFVMLMCGCSDNGSNGPKEPMKYIVKKTTGPVDISDAWDAGQWKNTTVLELTNYMGEKPEHFPKTQVKVLYESENVYVAFRVEDQYVKAVTDSRHGSVYKDSCVEFFFTPDPALENVYFNLEINCGGMMLFCYHDNNKNIEKYIDETDCEKIEIHHTLPEMITEEIEEPTVWTLSYKLPLDVVSKYCNITQPKPGVIWKANFYKCADMTSHPHWLTWSPVQHPTPNFHLPEYFGVLEFQ